jgi:hypothetical protein
LEEEVASPRGASEGAPPSVEHPASKARNTMEIAVAVWINVRE